MCKLIHLGDHYIMFNQIQAIKQNANNPAHTNIIMQRLSDELDDFFVVPLPVKEVRAAIEQFPAYSQ